MKTIRVVVVKFVNRISKQEIPLLRGAVIRAAGKTNVLFHNHVDDKYRYSYPLIQYKQIDNCAAIVGLNEGADAIAQLASSCNLSFELGRRQVDMVVDFVKPTAFNLCTDEQKYKFHIESWLPLNQQNYRLYVQMDSLSDKIKLLETILTANILSFAKGMDIHLEERISCSISGIEESYVSNYKGVDLMTFDLNFVTNVVLSDHVGLGKNVSLGGGVVTRY